MPIQIANESNASAGAGNEIKVKIAYSGEVMITYINESINYESICREIREICRFQPDQVFTMKWVDEENDPCTIQSDLELDEAIRLYEVNRDSELVIHGESLLYLACRQCQNRKYLLSYTGWSM
ncbi:atypical protein kinase C-like [Uranotaenia lowii]|uniref:atypical protein kinase C-like n=1 Tax=Uranotaenia lowii TaxID=190385 RepID=UPI002479BC42|nr:atypical protein kinase C-like [Uranotaenia lowii]